MSLLSIIFKWQCVLSGWNLPQSSRTDGLIICISKYLTAEAIKGTQKKKLVN